MVCAAVGGLQPALQPHPQQCRSRRGASALQAAATIASHYSQQLLSKIGTTHYRGGKAGEAIPARGPLM
eukprot:scaffold12630_cov118-Isochrysis_galbana.AAC.3